MWTAVMYHPESGRSLAGICLESGFDRPKHPESGRSPVCPGFIFCVLGFAPGQGGTEPE